MESMTYQEWNRRRQGRNGSTAPSGRKKGKPVQMGCTERRRLLQLFVCTMVFVATVVGKGVFPERMETVQAELRQMLCADTDLSGAFVRLGRSLSRGDPVGESLGDFCIEVFSAEDGIRVSVPTTSRRPLSRQEANALLEQGSRPVADVLGLRAESDCDGTSGNDFFADTAAVPSPEPTEPEVVHVDYTGPALPANATMDKYRLDLAETVSPVIGRVSSGFGWREHPVDGGEKFHNGADLAVDLGTPVKAFAAGTVEYIGDSPVYGLYLQIDHGNGVSSFYAHCEELLVQQGKTVTAGEQIALAGETGNATGPHLHFELKRNGIRLDPVYYIETK
ncbi:M23 family metallopeptidase [Pseudoflavonifractor sp. MSJ-37]|uniref:M23 family metallopeptidase n=1 Tax=Pseudoflavonifractor sp. MSJ-37 TaxID=2841531 RepID=UPI001C0F4B97|nr:M23 family metallopeptidase [Pseudoflavonifractor sp. MSJ-37]MBU5434831.1 M23 family metallopeptidase [Pseudoflavonifractor sp. MSJ-37]